MRSPLRKVVFFFSFGFVFSVQIYRKCLEYPNRKSNDNYHKCNISSIMSPGSTYECVFCNLRQNQSLIDVFERLSQKIIKVL